MTVWQRGTPRLRPTPMWALLVVVVIMFAGQAALGADGEATDPAHRGWLSVIPPVLAIGLALWKRQVLLALVLGLYTGILILEGNPFTAFLRLGDKYLVGALADDSHAAILMFSTILGGMVGVLSRSGATEGIVHWLGQKVRGRRGKTYETLRARHPKRRKSPPPRAMPPRPPATLLPPHPRSPRKKPKPRRDRSIAAPAKTSKSN